MIIANGAKRRKLDIPGEDELAGRGVSYCATCDGAFYKDKITAVVGGGNTAVEDALFLANTCREVHIIHRRDQFRAGKVLVDALSQKDNIILHMDTVPVEILPEEGAQKVGAFTIQNVKTQEKQTLLLQGVFVAIGLNPDNQLFKGQVGLDPAGYISCLLYTSR